MKIFISYTKEPPRFNINYFIEEEKILLKTDIDILGEIFDKDIKIDALNFSNNIFLASVE